MVFVCFATKKCFLFYLSKHISTPYLLATSNQISRTYDAPHGSRVYGRKSRVYEQYTREDHAMGNTDQSFSIINIYIHTYIIDIIRR